MFDLYQHFSIQIDLLMEHLVLDKTMLQGLPVCNN
jgi:hypothetical protein